MSGRIFSMEPHKFYSQLLMALIVIVVVTILLLSAILYINFESIGLYLIHNYIKDTLSQVSYTADSMTQTAKTLIMQIYSDSDIRGFYMGDIQNHEMPKGFIRLKQYCKVVPYIHSIYIYNGTQDMIYTSTSIDNINSRTDFFDRQAADIFADFKNYRVFTPISRIIPELGYNGQYDKQAKVYTILFYELQDRDNKLDKAVILNISEDWMRNMIDAFQREAGSNIFIVNSKGDILISDDKHDMLENASGEGYVQKVLASQEPSGYFIENVDGVKSLITYVSSGMLEWKFVRVTPYVNIISKVDGLKRTTFLIAFIILAVGAAAAYALSRMLQKPMDNMIRKVEKLESEKRDTKEALRQKRLQDRILGNHMLKGSGGSEPSAGYEDINTQIDFESPVVLALLKLDRYNGFCNSYSLRDQYLLKFAIMNIAAEIASAEYVNECVDMGEDRIVLLLQGEEDAEKINDKISGIMGRIQAAVKKHLELSISMAIGHSCPSFADVPDSYMEVLNALNYRLYFGYECIIFAADVEKLASREFEYPVLKEKLLIDALMTERIEEAKETFNSILADAACFSHNLFRMAISRLLINIGVAVDTLERNSGIDTGFDYGELQQELGSAETIDTIRADFFKLFGEIGSKLEERKKSRHDELMKKVIEMINNEFSNQNFTVDHIADSINLSAGYVGQLFKKFTSKSITDYLNEFRIEKAKEMLVSTNFTVNEISERVGITNTSYFYTLFKKMQGVTPNDFRQKQGIS